MPQNCENNNLMQKYFFNKDLIGMFGIENSDFKLSPEMQKP